MRPVLTGRGRTPLLAILLALGALTLFPLGDGIAKHLSETHAVVQLSWARFLISAMVVLPFALARFGRQAVLPKPIGIHVLRTLLVAGAITCYWAAVARIPLADALGVYFISPLVATVLSGLLLKEAVGLRRLLAVLAGFAGALMVIKPSASMDLGSLFAAGSGLLFGCYLVATRVAAVSTPALVTLAFQSGFGTLVMTPLIPFVWQPITGDALELLVLMGLLTALAHFMLIKAFEHAPASVIAPIIFVEIVSTTAIGFIVFGDFPDPLTWLGIAVIVAAGLYVTLSETRQAASPT